MKTMFVSARVACGRRSIDSIPAMVSDSLKSPDADLRRIWLEIAPDRSLPALSALLKMHMRLRLERGETPAAVDYFDEFPELKAEKDRVVSLVYEEFCLCEEKGLTADPSRFCSRYADWRDSLASQLEYHRFFGKAVAPPSPRFPEAGESFQWFQLRSVLGEGGAAHVFAHRRRARQPKGRSQDLQRSRQGALDIGPAEPYPYHAGPVGGGARQGLGLAQCFACPYRPGLPLNEVIRRLAAAKTRPTRAVDLVRVLFRPGRGRRSGSSAGPLEGRSRRRELTPPPSPGSSCVWLGARSRTCTRNTSPRRQTRQTCCSQPTTARSYWTSTWLTNRTIRIAPSRRTAAARCPTWRPNSSVRSSTPRSGTRSANRPISTRSDSSCGSSYC